MRLRNYHISKKSLLNWIKNILSPDLNEELSDENMAVLSENATLSEIIKDKIAVIAYLKERLKVLNRMRFNRNTRVRKSNNFCDNEFWIVCIVQFHDIFNDLFWFSDIVSCN